MRTSAYFRGNLKNPRRYLSSKNKKIRDRVDSRVQSVWKLQVMGWAPDETHENTTEASNHAPQVAEIFIGFSNTRASLFDLARSVFLISIKYVLFWSHTSWHSNLSFKSTCGAGETGEAGWPWGRGTWGVLFFYYYLPLKWILPLVASTEWLI